MKWVLVILCVLGIAAASLALREHYRDAGDSPCSINEHWDCGIVNHSPYAMVYGVPVAAIGMAGYSLIGILGLWGRRNLLLLATLVGMAFALYLTNIEARVLGVWCLYCVISQAIIAALLLLSIGWVVSHALRGRPA